MWHGNLAMVEHHSGFRVRFQNFPGVPPGNNSVLCDLVPDSTDIAFASAMVVDGTLWIFGTNNKDEVNSKSRTRVHSFWSNDPQLRPSSWQNAPLLQLPQNGTHDPSKPSWMVPWWTAYNTGPTRGKLPNGTDAFFLAIELGTPSDLIGQRFTSVFAACIECASTGHLESGWQILDPQSHIYRKDRYSACPTMRWYNGFFYLVTLYEDVPNPRGGHCASSSTKWDACLAEHVVRSKDLQHWEESPYGGGLIMGLPDGNWTGGPDHQIIPGSLLDEMGSPSQKMMARNQSDDINRSDMDMVTLPDGRTYVIWGTGNQGVATPPNQPMGFSGAGIVNATEQKWLESYFD
jgi:hypothetical protein